MVFPLCQCGYAIGDVSGDDAVQRRRIHRMVGFAADRRPARPETTGTASSSFKMTGSRELGNDNRSRWRLSVHLPSLIRKALVASDLEM